MIEARHYYVLGGVPHVVDQVVCERAEWDDRGRSFLSGWSAVFCDDGRVLAIRVRTHLPARSLREDYASRVN